MVAVLSNPKLTISDDDGSPLAGGKLFYYTAGTTTKQDTWTDSTGSVRNTNPVVLDARGEALVWLDPALSYKMVVARSGDTDPPTSPIWTVDGISSLDASQIEFTQSGTGAVAETVQAALRRVVYLDQYGAVGDGTTDDSTALTNAMAALPHGGEVRGTPGKNYYFANPPALARGIKLVGPTVPGKPRTILPTPGDYAATITLPSTKTITLGAQCELSGWLIWRQGLVTPTYPTISDTAAQATYAAFAGTAVTCTADDPHVHDNLIIGFATGISLNTVFRPNVHDNHIDCTNGIQATVIGDCGEGAGICNNSCRPYLIQAQPYAWKTNLKTGKAYYFHDTADGLIATGNFSYGYTIGLHLKNVYAVRAGGWFDNIGGSDPTDAAGTTAVKTEGACDLCVITAHGDSHDINFDLEHSSGAVTLNGCTSGLAVTNQLKLGASSSGYIDSLVMSGATATPIYVASGVGKWDGYIQSASTATSGVLIFLANYPADTAKVVGLRRVQTGTPLTDVVAGGTSTAPSLAPNTGVPTLGFYTPDASTVAMGGVGVFRLPSFLFANLPASRSDGDMAIVTDSTTTTYGASISGGGSNKVLACYLNAAWKVA